MVKMVFYVIYKFDVIDFLSQYKIKFNKILKEKKVLSSERVTDRWALGCMQWSERWVWIGKWGHIGGGDRTVGNKSLWSDHTEGVWVWGLDSQSVPGDDESSPFPSVKKVLLSLLL